jgi:NIMA (never in mitosis gene a)-related kinase 1/4/5
MSIGQFEILNKLGEGAFSNVFRVRRKTDNMIYALKKVKFGSLGAKDRENALNEVRLLASVSHANIVAYKEAFFDEGTNTLCIVMEYAAGGDLLTAIERHKRQGTHFAEKEVWDVFIQLLHGLRALHALSILHRDLKCANIFLGANGLVKIGDLNVSKVSKRGLAYTQTGTPYYASPEVWRDQPYNSSSDIWSLGCVIYEMSSLQPPFQALDMQQLFRKVVKGMYPELPRRYSTDLSNLIHAMLQVNATLRPSCERMLEMPPVLRNANWRKPDDADTQLLQTIKLVPSLRMLTNRLPAATYERKPRGFSARAPNLEGMKENCADPNNERKAVNEDRVPLHRLPLYSKHNR